MTAMAQGPRPTGARASFSVPGFGRTWATGWMWHGSRWAAIFVSTFEVNRRTGNPLLVQIVGSVFFAPMFFGGILAGLVSDRFDRARTISGQLLVLAPASLVMGVLVATDLAPLWSFYVFVLLVGVGNVVDMTSRRTFVLDLVGPSLVTNAVALESFALFGGNTLGSASGGALIDALGVGAVFGVIGGVYLAAFLLFRSVPPIAVRRTGPPSSVRADLREGLVLLRANPSLRSLLGVTVVLNFFFFAFMPLVPVFASKLEVGALLAGLLASANGLGTMAGSYVIASWQPTVRGRIYVVGGAMGMVMLAVFANMPVYALALPALFLCGFCAAGFGSTQGSLVAEVTDPEVRGRAMGLLSMAIGSLPFGMFSLGVLARETNPSLAVTVSSAAGLVVLALWLLRRPEIRRVA